jgi:hypothetical protein
MKTLAALLLVIATAALAAELHPTQPFTGLTMHEWGTFTSVAGENGAAIDWDTLGCKNDLPRFVNDYGYRGLKFRLHGTVRMETPVLYFYSSRELNARVKVGFPHGVITEWYPQADHQDSQITDTSLRSVTGGIEWKNITVQPDAAPAFPVESGPSHYYAARETDAAPVAVGEQHEKFLFYRGVGRFPIPLSARLSDDGRIVVENRGAEPVPIVIAFENRAGRIGYRIAGRLDAAIELDPPQLNGSFPSLAAELETALIAQGLFPKEAEAMVATWRDSWFEEGSRLIYIVPRPTVDAILPLEINPAPSHTTRVFVGRIELITPETKRTVESAIARGDWPAVNRYGRFLQPILLRIYSGNFAAVNKIEGSFRNFQQTTDACN